MLDFYREEGLFAFSIHANVLTKELRKEPNTSAIDDFKKGHMQVNSASAFSN